MAERAGLFDCICDVPEGTPPKEHDEICRQWNGARLLGFVSYTAEQADVINRTGA